jgi:predicted CXXCH cytochrome family protein
VASVNNGVSSLTADSCAGCHRVHTANGPMLLQAASEEELCLSCHGAASTGATTDVETGIQYVPATNGTRTATQLGALRGGGFEEARIDSANAARIWRSGTPANVWAKVRVEAASAAVTSSHLPGLAGLTQPGVAWGNGAIGSGVGPTVEMSCGSCHNPHGNGKYRILNPIPDPTEVSGTFTPVATARNVADSAVVNPTTGEADTKNYTVIQVQGTPGNAASYWLYSNQVTTAATTGDYWHSRVPWNSALGDLDAPNGLPYATATDAGFNDQITAWCSSCHTRHYSTSAFPSGDSIFMRRHQTTGILACTTCHVAHGSDAAMAGPFAGNFPYPDDPTTAPAPTLSASSRLLKVDGRGTCQLCHDPTDTVTVGTYTGPVPVPGVP